jgi:hypothetical protein
MGGSEEGRACKRLAEPVDAVPIDGMCSQSDFVEAVRELVLSGRGAVLGPRMRTAVDAVRDKPRSRDERESEGKSCEESFPHSLSGCTG